MAYIGRTPTNAALTAADLADGIVSTAKIAADAVTDAKIADDVVGTEHLTANEVDTAALKGDAVTGAELADNAVNSEHYTDGSIDNAHIADDAIDSEHYAAGSIDTAHIADGQITTAKLATAVFTGATDIGAAIADADLFLMDDGAGGTIRKTTAARIKTYAGGANTPAFEATITTEQNPSSTAATKINFDSEVFDVGGVYDTSNKRFTPGVAGKYFIYCNACIGSNTNTTLQTAFLHIYKNGSALRRSLYIATGNYTRYQPMFIANVVDLDADDYIEMYTTTTITSGTVEVRTAESFFGGYKIIE